MFSIDIDVQHRYSPLGHRGWRGAKREGRPVRSALSPEMRSRAIGSARLWAFRPRRARRRHQAAAFGTRGVTVAHSWRRGAVMASALVAALAAWPTAATAAVVQPRLLTAANYTVMGGSAITNTGPTLVTGNLAISPGNASSVTGFPPGVVTGAQDYNNAAAIQAQTDLVTAYNDAAGATPFIDMSGVDLGGKTLTPGVYHFSSSAQLTGTLTLDGQGSTNATFIFQIGSTLTTASGSRVVLVNGAGGCAVFWQVTSSATLGTTTSFQGNLIALTSITLTTGASIGVGGGVNGGRALARNGALTLDSNLITPPPAGCGFAAAPSASPTPTASPIPTSTSPRASTAPSGTPGMPNTAASGATPDALPWVPFAVAGLLGGMLLSAGVWIRARRP